MIPWGLAADRYGRRPVLIISCLGISISTILFGFSSSIWKMILFRSLAGMCGGSLVTVRTMVTENSDKTNQAKAFSYFSFAGHIGILIGPLVSGALSDPVKQYPRVFGNFSWFQRYPYMLATVSVGTLGLIATAVSFVYIKETLHRDKSHHDVNESPKLSRWQLLRSRDVVLALLMHAHIIVIGQGQMASECTFLQPADEIPCADRSSHQSIPSSGSRTSNWEALVLRQLK